MTITQTATQATFITEKRPFLSVLAQHKKTALTYIILGALAGFTYTQVKPQHYTTISTLKFTQSDKQDNSIHNAIALFTAPDILTQGVPAKSPAPKLAFKGIKFAEGTTLTSLPVLSQITSHYQRMVTPHITAQHISGTDLVKLRVQTPSRMEGISILNKATTAVQDKLKTLQQQQRDTKIKALQSDIDALESSLNKTEQSILTRQSQKLLNQSYAPNQSLRHVQKLTQQIETLEEQTYHLSKIWQDIQYNNTPLSAHVIQEIEKLTNARYPAINNLRREKSTAEIALFELLQIYGYKHPKVIKARGKVEAVKTALTMEWNSIKSNLHATIDYNKDHLKSLKQQLKIIPKQKILNTDLSLDIEKLKRKKAIEETLYQEKIHALTNLSNTPDSSAQFSILSAPKLQQRGSDMHKDTIIGAIIGGILALLSIASYAARKQTLTSAQNAQRLTGQRCITLIPEATPHKGIPLSSAAIKSPGSVLAESIRSIRCYLHLQAIKGLKTQTIAVTSSLPDEGKTTLSLWLAKALAKSGNRTIIIDTDLRRPTLQHSIDGIKTQSLNDYIIRKADLQDIIHKDSETGLHVITANAAPHNALDILSADLFDSLLSALKETYDTIIIDTPACLAAHDAALIAEKSDITLFTIAWHKTKLSQVQHAMSMLTDCSDHIASVLTRVDIHTYLKYGYGQSIDYYEIES